MAKQSNLPKETTMYSTNPTSGEVITHHLPWERTSPQLETYTRKGFTFERPLVATTPVTVNGGGRVNPLACPECGRPCKSEFGLAVHRRVHSKD